MLQAAACINKTCCSMLLAAVDSQPEWCCLFTVVLTSAGGCFDGSSPQWACVAAYLQVQALACRMVEVWTGCWLHVQCDTWCQESCWLAVLRSAAAPADEPGLGKTVQVRVHNLCVVCCSCVLYTINRQKISSPAGAYRSEADCMRLT